MLALRLRDERALWRALGLVAGCCLLMAGCGKDTRRLPGSVGGSATVGGAGDSGGGDRAMAGESGASAGETGSGGEGEATAKAGAGGAKLGGGAGANAGDGAGANAGDSAGAGGSTGSTRPDGCYDLSHLQDSMRMRWDLHVFGSGFEADEGSRVRLVITFSGEPSYGLSETTIQNGSFAFVMPKAVEPYTGMGVYIDKDRDDRCTLGVDGLWQRTTGGVSGDFVWELTPDQHQPAGASPCDINGIFDLTVLLRCP